MNRIKIHTIGFTKKTAEYFFGKLIENNISLLIDTRLNTSSQLSGFAKAKDLEYFLKKICNINYIYRSDLAPTKMILDNYKNKKIEWEQYSYEYINLMEKRLISKKIDKFEIDNSCLLCSEDKPHYCHRRLLAEYLKKEWADCETEIRHIL